MKTVKLAEPGKAPREVFAAFLLGAGMNVYLKGRATDYEAFRFKVTGVTTLNGKLYLDGYDSESMNLRIALSDIDYVAKGRNSK